MSATANGFAHAFSTWIAGGNGLTNKRDGVMRYNDGPMKGMTRDQAQMHFQNEVWKNAAPEWKDEYAKRATTDMLSPSEQKAAAAESKRAIGLPTVTPPVKQGSSLIETFQGNGGMLGNDRPMTRPRQSTGDLMADQQRDSEAAAEDGGMDAPVLPVTPPVMQAAPMRSAPRSKPMATNQPTFGNRVGTGASQTGRIAQAKF